MQSIEQNDLEKFVGKNSDYYLRKFEEIQITGNKISWNWPAFFISGYWLLYRKMYIQALIMILGSMVLGCIPFIGWLVPIALPIGMGMYANALYFDHINKKMIEINKFDSNIKDSLIFKKGGTNLALPLVLAGIGILGIILGIGILGLVMSELMYY